MYQQVRNDLTIAHRTITNAPGMNVGKLEHSGMNIMQSVHNDLPTSTEQAAKQNTVFKKHSNADQLSLMTLIIVNIL